MKYFEKKTRFATVQWTGSNQSEVDSFLSLLPTLDDHYEQFLGVSTSVAGGVLTVSWTGSFMQFQTSHWVAEGLLSGFSDFVVPLYGSGLALFNTIES